MAYCQYSSQELHDEEDSDSPHLRNPWMVTQAGIRRRVSIAELIRQVIDTFYGEGKEDIRDMVEKPCTYLEDPSCTVDLIILPRQGASLVKQPKVSNNRFGRPSGHSLS